MDALIYTLMSGAERSLRAQQVHANNLANADTGGFRADLELARSETVTQGYGYDARHMSRLEANALSTRQGALRETGRELDVAVVGQGYFAVQTSGGEAYTRAGAFVIDADGALTLHGRAVLGDGGPIVLPEHVKLQIGADGLISILPPGERDMQPVDRLKLVNPAADELTKNAEGFIVARNGEPYAPDDTVRVRSGWLEGSNVAAVEEMIAVMSLNREFEVQMRMYRAADSMAEAGNRLVRG
ncbi:MAG TPA: flagellar basal body rod protein FlgF [Steroidobacter sp.]|jgi:flagellar basal-body rod protein FlgF|nr:flagellar basal body rod protein FlgF [Steroidobacteraceae bacterium]HLS81619.1 flagellar basal body rod protein FlgF [Steroidobacter sp.]